MWEVNCFAANCRLVESDSWCGQGGWRRCSRIFYPSTSLASKSNWTDAPKLLEDRTILENVMLPALAADASTDQARQQALAALSRCHMSDWAQNYPIDLSSGQRQQVSLARAVVNQPVLILADEPAAHLDANNAQTVINLLGEFASAGVTVIVASHLLLAPRSIAYREVKFASQHGGMP